ncbi:DUF4185 domain-containing protein [Lolliginicoccus levis]|uniref:DUF4185 domain-containing protein n=1 Tax=Lolliginicoccus levis TaxID=2919542 RepID=UPI00241C9DD1|nr:DUF4185 domain-containing protein [Lolliginicoccus levis]
MRTSKAVSLGLALAIGAGLQAMSPMSALAEPCGSSGGANIESDEDRAVIGTPLGRKPLTAEGPIGVEPLSDRVGARIASPARLVQWLTGPRSSNQTSSRFSISGTDLGIMWDNGATGSDRQVLIAYGDTFGDCSKPGQEWRYNTLMRTSDATPGDGLAIPDPLTEEEDDHIYGGSPVTVDKPSFAKQIIDKLGLAPEEFTVIPTAGIAVDGVQYINFMSVKQWGPPSRWTTNFSAIAVSEDNGENWEVDVETIRENTEGNLDGIDYVDGNENFQMTAYVKRDGFVYTFGTPSGRFGAARVARVAEADILDLAEYEYWDGESWASGDPGAATNVIPAQVSEMSVAWNEHLGKYIALYTNDIGSVVIRTADQPQGPWSAPEAIMTASAFPGGLYAPYIHPWSSGDELFFAVSLWSEYNVMLMRTTLNTDPPAGPRWGS